MVLLNPEFNKKKKWDELKRKTWQQMEVDLQEVERVIEMARKTPGLSAYESCLRQLAIFFTVATQYYQQQDPEGLSSLVNYWEQYRSAVLQRHTGVTPVELRAADRVVANIFDRFIHRVPNQNIAYDPEAKPLVYGGEGGLYGYYTHPADWNRPFAIINLPHAAFDNIWHWLALPHEVGHDLFATVQGLDQEMKKAIEVRMRRAVSQGEIAIPDVNLDLSEYGLPVIKYRGEELLAKIWSNWTDEAQADVMGILNCGGAAIVTLQQIIGFDTEDVWLLDKDDQGKNIDYPEPHPTGFIRNIFNIAVLRFLENGAFAGLASEIENRFLALRPASNEIVWKLARNIDFVKIPITEMEKSARLAAEFFCSQRFNALGGKSYVELNTFSAADQEKVNAIIDPLLNGDPTFTQVMEGIEPRHSLAATIFALEKDPARMDVINRTFIHFA